ncbi:Melibiose operon regulatory protein [compost metagenome]
MQFKTLQIGDDLRERISYSSYSIPLSICIDNFDDYFRREWSCHWHEEFEFGIVLKGTIEYTIYDGQEQVATKVLLNQGDGIYISTGCLHSAKALEPGAVLAGFVFPITFFDIKPFENLYIQSIRPIIESGITNMILHSGDLNDQPLLSSMKELCSITDQEIGYELHGIEMICKIWRLLTIRISQDKKDMRTPSANQVQAQRLKEVVTFIHAHFNEHISVDDMARSTRISRTECFRCFQAILGKSPMEYVTEYRLSMATMMLTSTNRTVSDIASSCGFNTLSYFCKLFREQCGLSPKKYREQAHVRG